MGTAHRRTPETETEKGREQRGKKKKLQPGILSLAKKSAAICKRVESFALLK